MPKKEQKKEQKKAQQKVLQLDSVENVRNAIIEDIKKNKYPYKDNNSIQLLEQVETKGEERYYDYLFEEYNKNLLELGKLNKAYKAYTKNKAYLSKQQKELILSEMVGINMEIAQYKEEVDKRKDVSKVLKTLEKFDKIEKSINKIIRSSDVESKDIEAYLSNLFSFLEDCYIGYDKFIDTIEKNYIGIYLEMCSNQVEEEESADIKELLQRLQSYTLDICSNMIEHREAFFTTTGQKNDKNFVWFKNETLKNIIHEVKELPYVDIERKQRLEQMKQKQKKSKDDFEDRYRKVREKKKGIQKEQLSLTAIEVQELEKLQQEFNRINDNEKYIYKYVGIINKLNSTFRRVLSTKQEQDENTKNNIKKIKQLMRKCKNKINALNEMDQEEYKGNKNKKDNLQDIIEQIEKISVEVNTEKTHRSFATNIKKYNAIINKLNIYLREESRGLKKENKDNVKKIEELIGQCKQAISNLQDQQYARAIQNNQPKGKIKNLQDSFKNYKEPFRV